MLKDPIMINKYWMKYREKIEFVKICVQLTEILDVCHCIFVICRAGSIKSA